MEELTQDKQKLIQEILVLEMGILHNESYENNLKELSEWFDEPIETLRGENKFKLYNEYIEDLTRWLWDYPVLELMDRIESLKLHMKDLGVKNE